MKLVKSIKKLARRALPKLFPRLCEVIHLRKKIALEEHIFAESFSEWQTRISHLMDQSTVCNKEKQALEALVQQQKEKIAALEELAGYDSLTELRNRRLIKKTFHEHIEILRRKEPLTASSVIFIDLDNVKSINDQHGHGAGDTVIVTVAKMIEKHFREIDIVVRWGGDEFVIITPNVPAQSIFKRLEELRERLSHIRIMVENNEGLQLAVSITASIGIAELIVHPSSADALWGEFEKVIAFADAAMYNAKATGRNRIVTAQQEAV